MLETEVPRFNVRKSSFSEDPEPMSKESLSFHLRCKYPGRATKKVRAEDQQTSIIKLTQHIVKLIRPQFAELNANNLTDLHTTKVKFFPQILYIIEAIKPIKTGELSSRPSRYQTQPGARMATGSRPPENPRSSHSPWTFTHADADHSIKPNKSVAVHDGNMLKKPNLSSLLP